MAWSYRQDRSDEQYHDTPGPALVKGEKLASTPGAAGTHVTAVDAAKVQQKAQADAAKANAVVNKKADRPKGKK